MKGQPADMQGLVKLITEQVAPGIQGADLSDEDAEVSANHSQSILDMLNGHSPDELLTSAQHQTAFLGFLRGLLNHKKYSTGFYEGKQHQLDNVAHLLPALLSTFMVRRVNGETLDADGFHVKVGGEMKPLHIGTVELVYSRVCQDLYNRAYKAALSTDPYPKIMVPADDLIPNTEPS